MRYLTEAEFEILKKTHLDTLTRFWDSLEEVEDETPPEPEPAPEDPSDPMRGFASVKVSRAKLREFLAACRAAKVEYGFGGKDPTVTKPLPIDFKAIDCSGFVRVALYHAANKLLIPDGSVHQREWFQKSTHEGRPFKQTKPEYVKLSDNRIRIAFLNPKNGKAGHVWLVLNGMTFESHGGVGPNSRSYTNLPSADYVFVLSDSDDDPDGASGAPLEENPPPVDTETYPVAVVAGHTETLNAKVHGGKLALPAKGKFVVESHLSTDSDFFPGGRLFPNTSSDGIANHLAAEASIIRALGGDPAKAHAAPYAQVWTPAEGGGKVGQGSVGDRRPTAWEETFLFNLYWSKPPRPGTKYLMSFRGKHVVVVGGYEIGPGEDRWIGGAQPAVFHFLGATASDTITLNLLADQSLSPGPLKAQT